MNTFRMLLSAAVLTLAATTNASADGDVAPHANGFSLKGFGTLGLAKSDNDTVQYVRDLSQPKGLDSSWSAKIDSVLGLQASYRFGDSVEAVAQAITRYRYDDSYSPELSWAYLRYDPNPSLSLRLGRMGTEFYMLADSRLVGYANLSVRPPPDFFDSLVISYFDGVDVSAIQPVGDALVRAKFAVGQAAEKTPFIEPYSWSLNGSLLLGAYIDYLSGPWQTRLSHARMRFENELRFDDYIAASTGLPGFLGNVPDMSVRDTWANYTSLGVTYESGPMQLQAMLNQIEYDTSAYQDSRAGYIMAGYRVGNVTPYIGYSRVKSKRRIVDSIDPAAPYRGIAQGLSDFTHSDQNTLFMGMRWDARKNIALKAQVDHIDATPDSLFPYREGIVPNWSGRMTVLSLALDFVF